MVSSTNCSSGLKVLISSIFIFSLVCVPSKAGVSSSVSLLEEGEMLVGSRPPRCVDKCFNCRPCMAALVIPRHDQKQDVARTSHAHAHAHDEEGDNYYLLSWKCKCGNKLFQP